MVLDENWRYLDEDSASGGEEEECSAVEKWVLWLQEVGQVLCQKNHWVLSLDAAQIYGRMLTFLSLSHLLCVADTVGAGWCVAWHSRTDPHDQQPL